MPPPDYSGALQFWSNALGEEAVCSTPSQLRPYHQNTLGLEREIRAVVKPKTTEEVRAVVLSARRFRTPLYPVSGGRNWGYGSALPVSETSTIVDLSGMRSIRNTLTLADHYAMIEPGVTQRQLYQAVKESGLPLVFNATAAGEETSVLGNSLDRGFGYFAMRPDDLAGLEVVLGTGEVLKTGYGHYSNAKTTANYKFGLGPAMDGLFFQSNFGIVTAAAVHLHPRRECHAALLIKLQDDRLFEQFVDILADLRRTQIFESVLHIGSNNRIRVTLAPLIYNLLLSKGEQPGERLRRRAEELLAGQRFAAWTGVGGLYGTKREVAARKDEIAARLHDIADVELVTPEDIPAPADHQADLGQEVVYESTKALIDFSTGVPSNGALLSPLWAIGETAADVENLDRTRLGLLFCCPALPLSGESARSVVDTARRVFAEHGFEAFMTLNIVNTKAMLCVLNLAFDKTNSEACARAHQCVDTLFDVWASHGIYPYRLGIQSMAQFVNSQDTFWSLVSRLKYVFDPEGIIAPGRYCPM